MPGEPIIHEIWQNVGQVLLQNTSTMQSVDLTQNQVQILGGTVHSTVNPWNALADSSVTNAGDVLIEIFSKKTNAGAKETSNTSVVTLMAHLRTSKHETNAMFVGDLRVYDGTAAGQIFDQIAYVAGDQDKKLNFVFYNPSNVRAKYSVKWRYQPSSKKT